jgi:hypothetical protein
MISRVINPGMRHAVKSRYWRNLIMRGTILTAVLFAATLAGCYTTGEVGYSGGYYAAPAASSNVYVSTPDLVTVSPGVQVVADYDEPVFYTDGFYWRYYNNGWYRSNNYSAGWYYYERPPVAVLGIERPYAYAHYRPQGYVARNRGAYRPAEPIVRDHRGPAYRPEPAARENPGYRSEPPTYRPDPVVRDHRDPAYRPEPAARENPGYRSEPPTYRSDPVVRDHREPAPAARSAGPGPAPASGPGPAPAPVVRDHRAPAPAAREEHTRDHRH